MLCRIREGRNSVRFIKDNVLPYFMDIIREVVFMDEKEQVKEMHRILTDMGFTLVKKGLYCKKKGNIEIYRDYRYGTASTYAYMNNRRVSPYLFKESSSIELIEHSLQKREQPLQFFLGGMA